MPAPSLRLALVAISLALLAAACVVDVRARRVPNWLTAPLAICAIAAAASRGGFEAMGVAVAGMAVGLALYWIPYSAGFMGAGDVKLAASAAGWLGPFGAVWLVLWASVAGGLLSLVAYAVAPQSERAAVRDNLRALARAAGTGPMTIRRSGLRRGVPYGVGIAVAAAALIVLRA